MKPYIKFINYIKIKVKTLILRIKKPQIIVYSARLSGDGNFIDIRYTITRPDANDNNESIYLVEENSKIIHKLARIMRYGTLRTRHNKKIHSGTALFTNTNKSIIHGSKLTLIYGKMIKKNIEVI